MMADETQSCMYGMRRHCVYMKGLNIAYQANLLSLGTQQVAIHRLCVSAEQR
jgi:hypothetical protein